MILVSILSLTVLAGSCLAGIFSRHYEETWLQFFGLAGTSVWAIARLVQVIQGDWLTEQQVVAHLSLALYAAGTVGKVLSRQERQRAMANSERSGT